MPSVLSVIQNTVLISYFNRGLAGRIFKDVKANGAKVVLKYNTAECVLLAPDEYIRIIDEINDSHLEVIALDRLSHFDPVTLIPEEEVWKHLGITEDDL